MSCTNNYVRTIRHFIADKIKFRAEFHKVQRNGFFIGLKNSRNFRESHTMLDERVKGEIKEAAMSLSFVKVQLYKELHCHLEME